MNPFHYISASQARNAGHATPEATLETALWAIVTGDYEQALACHTPERRAVELSTPENRQNFFKAGQLASSTVKGFQILAKKNLGDGKVEFKIKKIAIWKSGGH
jgi:hypothetical protein